MCQLARGLMQLCEGMKESLESSTRKHAKLKAHQGLSGAGDHWAKDSELIDQHLALGLMHLNGATKSLMT